MRVSVYWQTKNDWWCIHELSDPCQFFKRGPDPPNFVSSKYIMPLKISRTGAVWSAVGINIFCIRLEHANSNIVVVPITGAFWNRCESMIYGYLKSSFANGCMLVLSVPAWTCDLQTRVVLFLIIWWIEFWKVYVLTEASAFSFHVAFDISRYYFCVGWSVNLATSRFQNTNVTKIL